MSITECGSQNKIKIKNNSNKYFIQSELFGGGKTSSAYKMNAYPQGNIPPESVSGSFLPLSYTSSAHLS